MEEWANGKLGSRSMIFLIFGLNNKQLEYEGIKRQVILKVKLISKLKNIDTITYVWQAIRKEVVRPNPICVSPRCVRTEKKTLLSNVVGAKNSFKQISWSNKWSCH